MRYACEPGATRITGSSTKAVDLPGGRLNHRWTKNVIASPDGRPAAVAMDRRGGLPVADDGGGAGWRATAAGAR